MKHVLIIGAGPMSVEYVKVLKDQGVPYTVIGRSEASANSFSEKTGENVISGGLQNYVSENDLGKFSHAIVVTGVNVLYATTKILLNAGIKNILVEKPGGINAAEINELADLSTLFGAQVFVAYNRRFFQSVIKAQEMIAADGGITSFHFEFTEWAHVIGPLKTADEIKQKWFLANSTHVVDLAFYLGGLPAEMNAYRAGSLTWHEHANFAGAGVSDKKALFSYHANWNAPGRWSVEIFTKNHRLYFRPMESLQVQSIGSVEIKPEILNSDLDQKYKPGLFLQTQHFLNNSTEHLCSIQRQKEQMPVFNRMSGYESNGDR